MWEVGVKLDVCVLLFIVLAIFPKEEFIEGGLAL